MHIKIMIFLIYFCMISNIAAMEQQGQLSPCPAGSKIWNFCYGTVEYQDGSKYAGEWRNSKFNGHGILTAPSKPPNGGEYVYKYGVEAVERYDGEWVDGVFDRGAYIYPDGRKYVGAFKNGEFEGNGTLTSPDGGRYVGEFKNSKPHGNGTSIMPDGAKYVGEFENGEWGGQGSFTAADGSFKYIGEFKGGHLNGRATEVLGPVNTKYVGEWKDNKKTIGVLTMPDGSKYSGNFRDNLPNGEGILYGAKGEIVYQGLWKDGNFLK